MNNPENVEIRTNRNESSGEKRPHELLFLLRRRSDVVETYTTQGGGKQHNIELGSKSHMKRGENGLSKWMEIKCKFYFFDYH